MPEGGTMAINANAWNVEWQQMQKMQQINNNFQKKRYCENVGNRR
jgi:hypothetical protein